jgi:hypothetical protein
VRKPLKTFSSPAFTFPYFLLYFCFAGFLLLSAREKCTQTNS